MNLRACWTMMRVTWMIWFQNRAFFFLLAFGWMISPLVALFIWSTAADGRSLGGMTQGELVAYYLVFILVNQLTYSQTYWTFGDKIRDGRLSPMLLRPFSPVLYTLVTEVEGKGVYLLFVVPVSTVLALLLHPKIHVTLPGCLTFVVSLLLAWFLRFFWGYWIALLAFWFHRPDIALAVQDDCIFVSLLFSLLNLATGVMGLVILYRQVQTIHGWTLSSSLVLLGVFQLLGALRGMVFGPSLERLTGIDGEIGNGRFDFILLRPVNVQFLASF